MSELGENDGMFEVPGDRLRELKRAEAERDEAVRLLDKALSALEKLQPLIHAECAEVHVAACDFLTRFLAHAKVGG